MCSREVLRIVFLRGARDCVYVFLRGARDCVYVFLRGATDCVSERC